MLNELCVARATTTAGAFRAALDGFGPATFLDDAGLGDRDRQLLATWRGTIDPLPTRQ